MHTAANRGPAQIRLGAWDLIELCVDPGTWESWDEKIDLAGYDFDDSYRAALVRAAEKAGTDESVVTGYARIDGLPVALIVSEFRFLGGSIGCVAAQRVVDAVRRATREGLPVIAATSSGGTRMQEGTPAFAMMIDISRAIVDHKAAGLPYIVYLRDPTMGGVFASWGSLGHVCVAEPNARVGFLGSAVYEALYERPFPEGVQTAEHLVRHGIVDAIVPTSSLADVAVRALRLLAPDEAALARREASAPAATIAHRSVQPTTASSASRGTGVDAWDAVTLTRRDDRPGVRELLEFGADDVLPLNGTQAGETGGPLVAAVSSLRGTRCIVVGQDRRKQDDDRHPFGAAALRTARRAVRLAGELGLPLVCIVDTPGAELSANAEEQAIAPEIARCIADIVSLTVPTVSVILGQGCGGGALALLPAQRVVVAENAWLAPLPPEGASAILHRDTAHAADMARLQRIGARDLLSAGIADVVIGEETAAHLAPRAFSEAVATEVVRQIQAQIA